MWLYLLGAEPLLWHGYLMGCLIMKGQISLAVKGWGLLHEPFSRSDLLRVLERERVRETPTGLIFLHQAGHYVSVRSIGPVRGCLTEPLGDGSLRFPSGLIFTLSPRAEEELPVSERLYLWVDERNII